MMTDTSQDVFRAVHLLEGEIRWCSDEIKYLTIVINTLDEEKDLYRPWVYKRERKRITRAIKRHEKHLRKIERRHGYLQKKGERMKNREQR